MKLQMTLSANRIVLDSKKLCVSSSISFSTMLPDFAKVIKTISSALFVKYINADIAKSLDS